MQRLFLPVTQSLLSLFVVLLIPMVHATSHSVEITNRFFQLNFCEVGMEPTPNLSRTCEPESKSETKI